MPVASVIRAEPEPLLPGSLVRQQARSSIPVQRARAAGVSALILRLDWAFASGRDWGSHGSPSGWTWP